QGYDGTTKTELKLVEKRLSIFHVNSRYRSLNKKYENNQLLSQRLSGRLTGSIGEGNGVIYENMSSDEEKDDSGNSDMSDSSKCSDDDIEDEIKEKEKNKSNKSLKQINDETVKSNQLRNGNLSKLSVNVVDDVDGEAGKGMRRGARRNSRR